MKDIHHFLTDVRDELPANLNQADFCDAIANMTPAEFAALNQALKNRQSLDIEECIRSTIHRQNAQYIHDTAKARLNDYLEDCKAEAAEARRHARLESVI